MITADQLIAHAIGDYVLQSDWMAVTKTQKTKAALAHVATYVLPFLLLTQNWRALTVIVITHFLIDRWRLARYVCWVKNYLAPWPVCRDGSVCGGTHGELMWHFGRPTPPWKEVKDSFGYPKDRPAWLAMWLMIITDNIMHVVCNGLALHYWP